jgi:predicted MFS family arabinose efflux permease
MLSSKPLAGLRHNRDFLKLWAGQSVSLIGSQITRLALPLAAVLTLHANAAQMGLLGAAQLAPFLVLGLVAGVWVDRLRRRPILIAADVGRAALLAMIPILALSRTLRIEHLYAIGFLFGTLELFFEVAYQSFLPSIVQRDQLTQGNSMLQLSDSTAQVAGPGVAGALVQLLTAPVAIIVDALSFVVSAITLVLIRTPEPARSVDQHPGVWAELREGLKLVVGHPWLRAIAGCTATLNFFANLLMTVYILYVTSRLGLTPAVIGAIFAVGGASTILGTMLAGPVARRLGLGPALIAASVVIGLAGLLIPLAGGPGLLAVALLAGTQVLWGLSRPIFDINQLSLRQSMTADRLQGRVNASMLFIVWGVIPFGSLLGGALGSTVGLRPTVAVGAAGMLLAVLWMVFSPIRSLRTQPSDLSEAPAA